MLHHQESRVNSETKFFHISELEEVTPEATLRICYFIINELCYFFNENILYIFFTDAQLRLCEFHREKSWKEWCAKIINGVSGQQDVLKALLRRITHAKSKEALDAAVNELKSSDPW